MYTILAETLFSSYRSIHHKNLFFHYILNGYSPKLLHACVSLYVDWQWYSSFNWTISGVIAFFTWNISWKSLYMLLFQHFKWEYPNTERWLIITIWRFAYRNGSLICSLWRELCFLFSLSSLCLVHNVTCVFGLSILDHSTSCFSNVYYKWLESLFLYTIFELAKKKTTNYVVPKPIEEIKKLYSQEPEWKCTCIMFDMQNPSEMKIQCWTSGDPGYNGPKVVGQQ